jgi:hypothetical protein
VHTGVLAQASITNLYAQTRPTAFSNLYPSVGGTTNITTNATESIVLQSSTANSMTDGLNTYGNTNASTVISGSSVTVNGPLSTTNGATFGGVVVSADGSISLAATSRTNWPEYIARAGSGSGWDFTGYADGAWHSFALPSGVPTNAKAFDVKGYIISGTVGHYFSVGSGAYSDGSMPYKQADVQTSGQALDFSMVVQHGGTTNLRAFVSNGATTNKFTITGYWR